MIEDADIQNLPVIRYGRTPKLTAMRKLEELEKVYAKMAEGFSHSASCGYVGHPLSTVMSWLDNIPGQLADEEYPELRGSEREAFVDHISKTLKLSHELAHQSRMFVLEFKLMQSQGSAATPYIFALKCCRGGSEEWRERNDLSVITQGDDDGTTRVRVIFDQEDDDEG